MVSKTRPRSATSSWPGSSQAVRATGNAKESTTTAHSRTIGASGVSATRRGVVVRSDCSKSANTVTPALERASSRQRDVAGL